MIISGYADPQRNLYLRESVQNLLHKRAIEMVRVRTSLAFYNRLFIVPKPNQKWRPVLDLSALNKFLSVKTFKMETPETIRISLQQGEWVTSLDFSDAYFHIPIHTGSRKYLRFHFQNLSYQFRSLPFGLSTAPMEFTGVVKEVKLMAQARGIKDPPVPRRLVDSSPHQRILPPGHPVPPCPLSRIGLGGEPAKIRIETQTGVRVCGLQVRPRSRPGQANPEPLGVNSSKGGSHFGQSHLSSQEVHVPDRSSHCDRKTSPTGKTTHETSSVAPQETLEGSGISGEGDSSSKVPSPTSMVDQGDKCLNRPTLTPGASCNSNLYRRLKRRLGCSLRRLHNKRHLVSSRKPPSHKFPGTKGRSTSPKKIPAFSARKSCFSCHRQHNSCGIHQQGWRYEVRLTLCPSMATPVLVQSEAGSSEGQAHPCDCRQVVSSGTDHSDRMVPSSGGLQPPGSNLAPATDGHVCNKVQS